MTISCSACAAQHTVFTLLDLCSCTGPPEHLNHSLPQHSPQNLHASSPLTYVLHLPNCERQCREPAEHKLVDC